MSSPLRVVHYLNQFFGGIGAEEHANVPVSTREGPVGPGRALQELLGERGSVVSTIICGDNYINEETDAAHADIVRALEEAKPDLLIAGPAFDAGRYGLACGQAGKIAGEMGIPSVTAMHSQNPGVASHRKDTVIVPTGASPAEMQNVIAAMLPIGLKLAAGEELGTPEDEGYIPRGIRKTAVRDELGYKRAVDMLVAKLQGKPFESEVPYEQPERVEPAPPVVDMSRATVALLSTGGLIPKGNPDRQLSGNPDQYFTYTVEGQQTLRSEEWEAFHGGYFNQIASGNPNYVMPLRYAREFEAQGTLGTVHPVIFTLPGVGTPVEKSQRFGEQIAAELKEAGVDACILVAT
jgi:glycine reductase